MTNRTTAAFIMLIFGCYSAAINAQTVCSFTFNSNDEIQSFQKRLTPQGFHFVEMVPKENDANWFQKACARVSQCDVVVVSGHFGGLFFGEKTTPTLSLEDLERASCENTCPALRAKEVFLMGCNTLASKTPDSRSPQEYMNVLIQDGFTRDQAESVVAARYSNEGFSMAERMGLAFSNSKILYGFDGKGPLGEVSGPKIDKYLAGTKDYSSHLGQQLSTNPALSSAFSGTNFRSLTPQQAISAKERDLSCRVLSRDPRTRIEGLEEILTSGKVSNYMDLLREHAATAELGVALREVASSHPDVARDLDRTLKTSQDHHEGMLSIQAANARVERGLGFTNDDQYAAQKNALIEKVLERPLDEVSAGQICEMAQKDPELSLKESWIRNTKLKTSTYLPYLMSCFQKWGPGIEGAAKSSLSSFTGIQRRDMIRSLQNHWNDQDSALVKKLSQNMSSEQDRTELFMSASHVPGNPTLDVKPSVTNCLERARAQPSAEERDGSRWKCALDPQINSSLSACLTITNEVETSEARDMDWKCLSAVQPSPSVGVCMALAARHPDPTKADDMRWSCWDHLVSSRSITKAECLRLADSMSIQGNQLKANWNCLNRVKDTVINEKNTSH